MRTRAIALCLLVVLAGCTGTGGDPGTESSTATHVTSDTATPTATPTQTATPTATPTATATSTATETATQASTSEPVEVNKSEFRTAFHGVLEDNNVSAASTRYDEARLVMNYTEYSENTTVRQARATLVAITFADMVNATRGYAPLKLHYYLMTEEGSRSLPFVIRLETAERYSEGELSYEEYVEGVWDRSMTDVRCP
ncbi:hypothetical protein [Halomicrobium urmianum]|uniref:hypothetical protein n=1 Tax=Halomicrobium urmianum TaxID=1586233 RepID=UPI001CD98DA4|nr:hypothetical protein [Halomicrobium urmianum]